MLVDLLTQFVGAKMTELKNWSKSLLAEYGFWKKNNVRNGHCPLPEWLISLFLNLSCDDEERHPKQIFNKDVLLRDAVLLIDKILLS